MCESQAKVVNIDNSVAMTENRQAMTGDVASP